MRSHAGSRAVTVVVSRVGGGDCRYCRNEPRCSVESALSWLPALRAVLGALICPGRSSSHPSREPALLILSPPRCVPVLVTHTRRASPQSLDFLRGDSSHEARCAYQQSVVTYSSMHNRKVATAAGGAGAPRRLGLPLPGRAGRTRHVGVPAGRDVREPRVGVHARRTARTRPTDTRGRCGALCAGRRDRGWS
jgi:hypothetical protein